MIMISFILNIYKTVSPFQSFLIHYLTWSPTILCECKKGIISSLQIVWLKKNQYIDHVTCK